MNATQAMLAPHWRFEGIERLDLLEWDEVHAAVQSILEDLDAKILGDHLGTVAKSGRNASPAWELFSYRVYQSTIHVGVDPVVVGIVCAQSDGSFRIRGDIAGETRGDILFETPEKDAVGKIPVLEATRDLAELLVAQASVVVQATTDPKRVTV